MTEVNETGDETLAGRRMVAELLTVHDMFRRDIAVLEQTLELLSGETVDIGKVPELISGMTTAKFVWQLRLNCDYYCNALSGHHQLEDHRMFPTMLRKFPELAPAIERLKSEHNAVHVLIGKVQSASLNLTTEHDTAETARALIADLATQLRAHLQFEQDSLFPYFRRMDADWHYG
jgi:hemerythrin-like domain-containing protein